MTTSRPVCAPAGDTGIPAEPTVVGCEESATPDRTTRVPPMGMSALQLPSMTPEQAYLLLDVIEWLHAAIWSAHESALVDLVIGQRVDSSPVAECDENSDEIAF